MENAQSNRQLYIILAIVALVIVAVVVGMLTGIIPGPGGASATNQVYNDCVLAQRGNCDGADLSDIWMSGAPIRNFSCVGCNFANSTHNGTNWSGSDLRNTDWTGANINSVNFSNVDLTGATNLEQAQLDTVGACSKGTKLPAGLSC